MLYKKIEKKTKVKEQQ